MQTLAGMAASPQQLQAQHLVQVTLAPRLLTRSPDLKATAWRFMQGSAKPQIAAVWCRHSHWKGQDTLLA